MLSAGFLYLILQSVFILFRKFGNSGNTGSNRSFSNGFCHFMRYSFIKYVYHHMVRIQLALGSQVSQGMGSSQFHFFVDLTGSYVQGATEEAREYGGVIDLVVPASASTI